MYYEEQLEAQIKETSEALKEPLNIYENTTLILKNQEIIMEVLNRFLVC